MFFEPEVYETIQAHLPDALQDMARFAYLTGWRKTQIARLNQTTQHWHTGSTRKRVVSAYSGRQWNRGLEKAGVADYHFHDLRRTATRNMALAGVPEKHIMQVTGHKTRYMLDRYNITVERDTHETLQRTQAYLNRKHGQKTDTDKIPEE